MQKLLRFIFTRKINSGDRGGGRTDGHGRARTGTTDMNITPHLHSMPTGLHNITQRNLLCRHSRVMLSVLVLTNGAVQPAPSERVILSEYAHAKCLDGSPAVYYISRGSNRFAFLFHLQGGGWCQTLDECASRAKTALGSSLSYPATMDLSAIDAPPTAGTGGGHDAFDRNATANPLFAKWNYVYVPYCDGASFSGDNSSISPALQFRGKAIREAVVASLRAEEGLSKATHAVVWGCSAGGAATYFHTDWFAAQLPAAMTRGMPDSGWFVEGDYARDGKPHYGARMANMYTMVNAASSLPASCVTAQGDRCLFAPNVVPHLTTPLFAINSKFDASMAPGSYDDGTSYNCSEYYHLFSPAGECDAGSVNAFGDYVTAKMKAALKPPHGAYVDSCYRHCGQTTDQISGHGSGPPFATCGVQALV